MRRSGWIVGAFLIVAALAGLTFIERPRLYLLTFGAVGLALLSVYCAVWFRGTRAGNMFVSLVAVGLFLSLLDPYVVLNAGSDIDRYEGSWSYKYHYVGDKDLGFVLPAGVVAESRLLHGERLEYDVIYSIDANGHRVTATSKDPAAGNVLFMGCSFTFGMGLNDSQTLPQLFSTFTSQHYNVINFGVPTYGLHQAVRALELGRPDPLLSKGKRYIVYSAIADHARRAAAAYSWAAQGPAYELGPDGTASYRGRLNGPASGAIVATVSRSAFLSRYVLAPLFGHIGFDPVPLYVGLVKRARQLAEEKYHAEFIMIFWDDDAKAEPEVKSALDKAGIAYIPVSFIIPDLNTHALLYHISPTDGHPTEAANRLIATYLARRISGSAATP